MNTTLKRDHKGELALFVAGNRVQGAIILGVSPSNVCNGENAVTLTIPLSQVMFAEADNDNVVPFVRPVLETR